MRGSGGERVARRRCLGQEQAGRCPSGKGCGGDPGAALATSLRGGRTKRALA